VLTADEGEVLDRARVVMVYWGDYFVRRPQARDLLDPFVDGILKSSYMDGLRRLGVGAGSRLDSFVIPSSAAGGARFTTPPASMFESQVQDQLKRWIGTGVVGRSPGFFETTLLYMIISHPR
jgi:hypothetical protein